MNVGHWWQVVIVVAGFAGFGVAIGSLLWRWTEGLPDFDDLPSRRCQHSTDGGAQILPFTPRTTCTTRPSRRHTHEGPGRTA